VKTAISIPDDAFRRVERHAARLHISRSEFFARAAQRWADELEKDDLTRAINDALDLIGGEQDENAEFLREAARQTFLRADGP
jgi:hypothetical protein